MSETARVLIVDDDPPIRRLFRAKLAQDAYEILVAGTAEEALDLIGACEIDAVVLDIVLPGMDGFEFCRRVRLDHPEAIIPVIVVTGLGDAEAQARATECGVDDFLTKPVAIDELRARVKVVVERRAAFKLASRRRAIAEGESRRWRLVSEVAGAMANCSDYRQLLDALRASFEVELGIRGVAYFELAPAVFRLMSVSSDDARKSPPVSGAKQTCPHEGADREFRSIRLVPVPSEKSRFLPIVPLELLCGLSPTVALMPIFIGGTVHGVLLFAGDAPTSDAGAALLEDLAPHFANAVGNVRAQLKSIELDQARSRMTTLLVHDLKNILSVIKGNLDFLSGPDLTESDRDEALGDARRAADQLLEMIVDLLDIGRAEEGNLTVDVAMLRVGTVVREVVDQLRVNAHAKGITLSCACASDPRALFDPKLLRRVLQNLLNNAFRYVAPRGHIDVTVERHVTRCVIRISNDGPPIAPQLRAHLFDKYGVTHVGQGHTNRGLGLYLCRLVVDAHGGSIAVVDRPGWGATFEIQIPTFDTV